MKYDYINGYVHIGNNLNKGKGRNKIRYNICLRDGNLTIIHKDLTAKQMGEIKKEIENQNNKLW